VLKIGLTEGNVVEQIAVQISSQIPLSQAFERLTKGIGRWLGRPCIAAGFHHLSRGAMGEPLQWMVFGEHFGRKTKFSWSPAECSTRYLSGLIAQDPLHQYLGIFT
jgi:hypothetical protein